MVLLTSGQVSVAISSIVVFLFTSALFLSGYVLQQKTVNDIRRAIKPAIAPLRPDLIIPPSFQEGDKWQGNAQVVVIDGATSKAQEEHEIAKSRDATTSQDEDDMVGATRWQKAAKLKEKKKLAEETERKKGEGKKKSKKNSKDAEKTISRAERRKKIKDEILAAGEGEAFEGYRRRKW